jgi:positive regulator of sigma E activity
VRARVNKADNGLVSLSVLPVCGESCGSCSKTDKIRPFDAENPKGFDLAAGDEVEVYASPYKTVFAGFRMFVLPLVFFAAGYAASNLLFGVNDILGFFTGCAGVSAVFIVNYIIFHVSGNKNLPTIIEKIQ